MPLIFPLGFKEKNCEPCCICVRITLGHDSENMKNNSGKTIDYYGDVSEYNCTSCGRAVCPLHFAPKFLVCTDCRLEGKGEAIQEVAEQQETQESRPVLPVRKRSWAEIF